MATLEELENDGTLARLAMRRVTPVVREVWLFKAVENWFRNDLGKLASYYDDELSTPLEQAWSLMASFIRGEQLFEGEDFWKMTPYDREVFELKSPDLRFFGWFPKPRKFLIAAADTFAATHEHGLHAGYRDLVVRQRDLLNLDEPKVVIATRLSDVF